MLFCLDDFVSVFLGCVELSCGCERIERYLVRHKCNLSGNCILFSDEDQQEFFESEANKKAVNNYGFRDCTQSIELLKSNGVRFPYCETDVVIRFINIMINDHYHVSMK